MRDGYLLDIGWLFFIVWGVVVAIVSYEAFGSDLFPARSEVRQGPPQEMERPLR